MVRVLSLRLHGGFKPSRKVIEVVRIPTTEGAPTWISHWLISRFQIAEVSAAG